MGIVQQVYTDTGLGKRGNAAGQVGIALKAEHRCHAEIVYLVALAVLRLQHAQLGVPVPAQVPGTLGEPAVAPVLLYADAIDTGLVGVVGLAAADGNRVQPQRFAGVHGRRAAQEHRGEQGGSCRGMHGISSCYLCPCGE